MVSSNFVKRLQKVDKPFIVAQTEQEVIVCKPAGMPAQRDASGDLDVLTWARRMLGLPLHLVHRLDRPVGGLLLLAKTSQGAAYWSRRFREGRIQKVYLAVTATPLYPAFGELRHYLARDTRRHRAQVFYTPKAGTTLAVLRYQVLAERGGQSLARITLGTGRFHQIRAQLAEVGSPIIGDVKYGYTPPAPDPRAIALWAVQLETWRVLPPLEHPYWAPWQVHLTNHRVG